MSVISNLPSLDWNAGDWNHWPSVMESTTRWWREISRERKDHGSWGLRIPIARQSSRCWADIRTYSSIRRALLSCCFLGRLSFPLPHFSSHSGFIPFFRCLMLIFTPDFPVQNKMSFNKIRRTLISPNGLSPTVVKVNFMQVQFISFDIWYPGLKWNVCNLTWLLS